MFTFVFTNWTALLGARVITLLLNVLPQAAYRRMEAHPSLSTDAHRSRLASSQ